MTAGIGSQGIAATRFTLPPTALAGLVGVALLVGGLLGVGVKSEFDAGAGARLVAPVAASSLETRLLAARAHILVGRGPLVRDPGATGSRPQATVGGIDHIGLTERLVTVSIPHTVEHGPLR